MDDLINGRTPEEIIEANRHCSRCFCDECAYFSAIECQTDLRRDCADLIKHLEAKQPKWISVKERLPVKQFRVIVRTGHGLVTTGWRSYHVDVRGGELWEVDEAHNYHNDVTHWMPLPKEPKEDT